MTDLVCIDHIGSSSILLVGVLQNFFCCCSFMQLN